MNYSPIRRLLFLLDEELSHTFSLKAMRLLEQIKLLPLLWPAPTSHPRKVFGLEFENPVGLAAGLDKNGDYIDALGALGFGFIEIGTVTPKPQVGNPKPRLFRLEQKSALINRMGFNNKGVDYLINQVKQRKYQGILGINIGKNASTPIENAFDDYRVGLEKVYSLADYITINISSPNTPGLRNLQSSDYLNKLLSELKKTQEVLANKENKYTPMLIKIAPDVNDEEITNMADAFIENKMDGVIATNTTLDRDQVAGEKYANESGGLSGEPLFEKSTDVLAKLKQKLASHKIPIIASGGIMSAEQAKIKIEKGADLIQLYSGLIYEGPELISACCKIISGNKDL